MSKNDIIKYSHNDIIMDVDEFDLDKIINYKDYPNFHNTVSQNYPLWNPRFLGLCDITMHTCNLCESVYIMSLSKNSCATCKQKMQKEIDTFTEFIKTNHPELQNNRGIDTRTKIILFANRHTICNDVYSKCGIYMYCTYLKRFKNCLSWNIMRKILRRIRDTNTFTKNELRYLTYGNGACNKKMKQAIIKSRDYYPEIDTYYLDFWRKMK